ncbi:MAG: amidohydrolase family protein [Candidatus Kapabacteria bacterium]|nr:amidohydrolase family protein [Candidatus Kapabacteria bacterium]
MNHSLRTLAASAFSCLLLCVASARSGDEIPGATQQRPIALTNATIHTAAGPTLQKASIVFDRGVIVDVGTTVTIPQGARVIDCAGKHVYPGFIAPNTTIGLTEIDAVRSTRDAAEVGPLNPNAKAATAYNPDSDIIPTVRMNGVLLVNSVPQGGLVSGQAALMRTDGWTREDMAVKSPSAMVVNWPSMDPMTAPWIRTSIEDQRKEMEEAIRSIYTLFRNAKAYSDAALAGVDTALRDIRYEAMRVVFEKDVPLLISASTKRQIEAVIDFQEMFGLKVILVDAVDAHRVIPQLQKSGIPVIIPRVHSLPRREEDGYDAPFTLASTLAKANVPFAFSDGGSWQQRNLPFQAGTSRAFGLSEEDAVKALTIWPAKMFGVDGQYGSLEKGKSATLFISTGDALDSKSNVLTSAFIDGREIELTSRHTKLARKYRERGKR